MLYKLGNKFFIIISFFATFLCILALVKALGQLESNKIQAIQPIALVLIGVLPSIATLIISELIKFKSSVELKILEQKQVMLAKREALYKSLLESIEGFFVPENEVKKAKFFSEYRIA